jgi:hypothetical protein
MKLEYGKAVISHGWNKVVEAFNLKEKDVIMITLKDDKHFPARARTRDPFATIKMGILKLEE